MGKYQPLRDHLRLQKANEFTMDFSEIEAILGIPLPASATEYQAWWSYERDPHQPQKQAIATAGFIVSKVDLHRRRITFRRISTGKSA
jgi:hypothetical protein